MGTEFTKNYSSFKLRLLENQLRMHTYIIFLRGINVGGNKKIKMTDLKISLEKAGFEKVQTYIQSGNLTVNSNLEDSEAISLKIQDLIQRDFGFQVPVLITTGMELQNILDQNPFNHAEIKNLYFALLYETPEVERITDFNKLQFKTEEFKVIDNCVYLNCKAGAGKAKLTNNLIENKLKVTATTRNLRTMQKMIELAS